MSEPPVGSSLHSCAHSFTHFYTLTIKLSFSARTGTWTAFHPDPIWVERRVDGAPHEGTLPEPQGCRKSMFKRSSCSATPAFGSKCCSSVGRKLASEAATGSCHRTEDGTSQSPLGPQPSFVKTQTLRSNSRGSWVIERNRQVLS